VLLFVAEMLPAWGIEKGIGEKNPRNKPHEQDFLVFMSVICGAQIARLPLRSIVMDLRRE
jgi:hypothetical protein